MPDSSSNFKELEPSPSSLIVNTSSFVLLFLETIFFISITFIIESENFQVNLSLYLYSLCCLKTANAVQKKRVFVTQWPFDCKTQGPQSIKHCAWDCFNSLKFLDESKMHFYLRIGDMQYPNYSVLWNLVPLYIIEFSKKCLKVKGDFITNEKNCYVIWQNWAWVVMIHPDMIMQGVP